MQAARGGARLPRPHLDDVSCSGGTRREWSVATGGGGIGSTCVCCALQGEEGAGCGSRPQPPLQNSNHSGSPRLGCHLADSVTLHCPPSPWPRSFMRIRLDRVIEVSLPNMTAAEVATSTAEIPKFKIDAEKWTAPYVPYAWGWWERFMLKK